ncbi:MAG: hypothetical protein HDR19_06800 [Lachnospiraceae bacterium]|nr:hypothetical protein [Lachnospiraceae bacterium]
MRVSISYYYYRGGTAAGPALSNFLSHHHVISYPRMYYLGVLSLCYLKKLKTTNESAANAKMQTLLNACRIPNLPVANAVNAVSNTEPDRFNIPEGNNNIQNTLYGIAWMPQNLFIGPAGKIRLDDPSQNNDKLPIGMPNAQKRNINQIITGLNLYSHSNIPHVCGAGGQTNAVAFDNEADFNRLVELFFDNIGGTCGCYDSKISDWLIGVNNNSRINYYNILFSTSARAAQEAENLRQKRTLVTGKFAVKSNSIKNIDSKKCFKALSKDADYVYGSLNNLEQECRDQQSRCIQSFL